MVCRGRQRRAGQAPGPARAQEAHAGAPPTARELLYIVRMASLCLPASHAKPHALALLCACSNWWSCFLALLLSSLIVSYKQHEQAACTCSGVLWSQRAGVEALNAKGLTTGLLAAGAGGPVPALGHGAAGAGDRGCWAQPHLPRAQRRALAAQLRGAYHADLSGRAGAAAACGCMCRVKAQKRAHDGS